MFLINVMLIMKSVEEIVDVDFIMHNMHILKGHMQKLGSIVLKFMHSYMAD